jgi:hypothetical protein
MTPAFAYLQARLQAHHGQRLDENGWRRLEMVTPYRLFLKNARETTLAPWLQSIGDADAPPLLEHRLWEGWQQSVDHLSRWAPTAWQPAIHWTTLLWHLPAWRQKWQETPLPPGLQLADSGGIATLEQAWRAGRSLREAWLSHWRSLWPGGTGRGTAPLEQLLKILQHHDDQFATLPDAAAARLARQQLQQQLQGLFRRHGGEPAALFLYLALLSMDFARLRGGLVWRALYHSAEGGTA